MRDQQGRKSVLADKINPIRETDSDAVDLAGRLVAEVRYPSIGVTEIGSGVPLVSRIAAAFARETGLFFCASDLSIHSKCLLSNANCSLLIGEPGKGDGLAHPRITMIGKASRLSNDHPDRAKLREVFLETHPKAELYVDFADFGFYPLAVERAQLNGGFGKAYHLDRSDMSFLSD